MSKAYVGSADITTKVFAPGNGQYSLIISGKVWTPFSCCISFVA